MRVWMHLSLAYVALIIYTLFYASDGEQTTYEPKKRRNKSNILSSYVGRPKAWITSLYQTIKTQIEHRCAITTIRHRRQIARKYQQHSPRKAPPWARGNTKHRHYIMAHKALLAQQAHASKQRRTIILDTDSKPIGIDNRATAFFSGDIDDFEGPLRESNRVVKGFGGSRTTGVKIGTAVIRIEDDHGRIHSSPYQTHSMCQAQLIGS